MVRTNLAHGRTFGSDPTQHSMSVADVASVFRVSTSTEFLPETGPITAQITPRNRQVLQ
jgi:hypothetical protein